MSKLFNTTAMQGAREKMNAILDARAAELATIRAERDKAYAEIAAHTRAMNEATEKLDAAAYSKAKNKKIAAENAAEMYSKRFDTIREKEAVSEQDSDAFIDDVLSFKAETTAQYEREALKLLNDLDALSAEYGSIIEDAKSVLTTWTRRVHANYRAYLDDPGVRTVRRNKPVDVHSVGYVGCNLYRRVAQFVRPTLEKCGQDEQTDQVEQAEKA